MTVHMQRAAFLILMLVHSVAWAQDTIDTTAVALPEWSTPDYDQAQKAYNGLYLTPMDNPALAGFDRQLVISYGGGVENLKVGGQAYGESPRPAFWKQRGIIDFAFAGKRKNVGVAVLYEGGNMYRTKYHTYGLAHSYRFHIRKHRITLGLGMLMCSQKSWSWQWSTFGDQIDPRYGYIYETQELFRPSKWAHSLTITTGLVYDWKRLFFSYSFFQGQQVPQSDRGTGTLLQIHTLTLGYHFKLPLDLTLSPLLSAITDQRRWNWSPSVTLTWRDHAFIGIHMPYLDQVRIEAGAQLWNRFRMAASVGFYHQDFMQELNGMAYAGGSLRYMLPVWKK